jgi:3-oxoacyl-[acyl-carrier protein] reductase
MSETIMITGASRGIGAEICRKLAKAKQANRIVALARESSQFDAFVVSFRADFPEVTIDPYFVDIEDVQQVRRVLEDLGRRGINVSSLVNNAGYTNPKSINEIDLEDFTKTLRINLLAPFQIIQYLTKSNPPLKLVVNIASTAGINGRPGWLTYSASKAAMINMTDVLRQELKVYGTRVVCISPGRCATDLRRILAPEEDPSTIMQPSDVAEIVSTLMSNVGHLIDSQNLVVRT